MKSQSPKSLLFPKKIGISRACKRLPLAIAVCLAGLAGEACGVTVTYTEATTGAGPTNWSAASWGGPIGDITSGDVAQFVSTSANMSSMVLDTNVTVGQLVKGGNKTWTLGTPSGAYSFTLNNTGGAVNSFGGSLAFVGANGTGGTLTVTPGIIIGSASGLLIGSTGSGASGIVNINGGVTGTGNLYLASGASSSAAITISTTAINNSGNLVIGKSDSSTVQSGTGTITISGGVGGNVGDITNYSAGAVTLSTTSINNTGTITNATAGSGTMTISANISNVTGVTQSSATSLLILSGSNTYTGLTTISTGTLQIGTGVNGGSIVGNILDNGTLISNRTGTWVYNGSISGSGLMNKMGSSTVTLTGSNSYQGGTTVNAGTLILTGSNTGTGGFTVVSGGTLQIGAGGVTGSIGGTGGIAGNITDNGSVIFKRTDDIAYGGIISGAGGLTVNGGNTVTLTGTNTYSGATAVTSSRLNLDFSNASAPLSNIIGSSSALTVSSGVVNITGNAGTASSQQFSALTTGSNAYFNAGGGRLNLTAGSGGTLTVAVGTLTLNSGSRLAINAGSGATVTTTTPVPTDPGTTGWSTSYGGDLVVNNNNGTGWNFAKSTSDGNGAYVISGLASSDYAAFPSAGTLQSKGGNAYLGGSGSLSGATNVYTLKIDTAGFGTGQALDLGAQTFTLGAAGSTTAGALVGGLLVVGDQDYEIKNGTIKGNSTSPRFFVVNQYSTGTLTISALISNGVGSTAFVKAGTGTAVLSSGSNTYDSFTQIQEGTLAITNGINLGTNKAVDIYSGATLEARDTFALTTNDGVTARNIAIGAGADIGVTSGKTFTVGGVVSSLYSDVIGSLVKVGAGTLTFTGINTYTGTTTISAGELDINGTQAAGSMVSVATGATLGGSGTVNGNVAVSDGTVNGSGLNVSGTATFDGSSTLSGSATISGGINVSTGTLLLTGTTNSNVAVIHGSTLTNNGKVVGNVQVSGLLNGSGLINGALDIENSGELAPGNGAGVTTVNGNLTLESGAQISLQVNGNTPGTSYDQIVVTGGSSLIDLGHNTLNLILSTSLSSGDTLTLLDNQGSSAISGSFSFVNFNGSAFSMSGTNAFIVDGYDYSLSYTGGDGNDLVLAVVAVPEPSTWAMLVGGLGVLVMFRKSMKRLS